MNLYNVWGKGVLKGSQHDDPGLILKCTLHLYIYLWGSGGRGLSIWFLFCFWIICPAVFNSHFTRHHLLTQWVIIKDCGILYHVLQPIMIVSLGLWKLPPWTHGHWSSAIQPPLPSDTSPSGHMQPETHSVTYCEHEKIMQSGILVNQVGERKIADSWPWVQNYSCKPEVRPKTIYKSGPLYYFGSHRYYRSIVFCGLIYACRKADFFQKNSSQIAANH